MSDVRPKYRVVVMGKTGSGKSFVCNRLIGREDDGVFPVYSGMYGGNTTEIKVEEVDIDGVCLQVVDTPDFFYMGHDVSSARAAFRDWDEAGSSSIPTAILFTVPLDSRFNSEDNILYNEQYMDILPAKYLSNIIIGFTKMGAFAGSVETIIQELNTLQNLWNAAKRRHVEFRENADARKLQRTLIAMVGAETRKENRNEMIETVQEWKDKIFGMLATICALIACIVRAISFLMVEYIIRPGIDICACCVSFCRRHPFVCVFAAACVIAFYLCWPMFNHPQEEIHTNNTKQKSV